MSDQIDQIDEFTQPSPEEVKRIVEKDLDPKTVDAFQRICERARKRTPEDVYVGARAMLKQMGYSDEDIDKL